MTMKTMTAVVTLVLLACLGLAIGRVLAQTPDLVVAPPGGEDAAGELPKQPQPPRAPRGAAPNAFVYQAQSGQPQRFTVAQPGGSGGFYSPQPFLTHPADGVHDEEAAKLIASDTQMQQESQALLAQYSETEDDEQKSKIKGQLVETLEKQFTVQQQLREREVAKIEARVKKLRELINKRNDARLSIIEKRLDQLVREADGLGWNSPAAGLANSWGAAYDQPVGVQRWPISPVPNNTPAKR